MLTLPIKKKWFDMIVSGEKKEEYREMSRYYEQRLHRYCGFTEAEDGDRRPISILVRFRNGYNADSPSFLACCSVTTGTGKPEWGAEPGKKYYVLHIAGLCSQEKEK